MRNAMAVAEVGAVAFTAAVVAAAFTVVEAAASMEVEAAVPVLAVAVVAPCRPHAKVQVLSGEQHPAGVLLPGQALA